MTVVIVGVTEPGVTCSEMIECVAASYHLPNHHVLTFDLDFILSSLEEMGNDLDALDLLFEIIEHQVDKENFSRGVIHKIFKIFGPLLQRMRYDILLVDACLVNAYTIDDWLNLYPQDRNPKFVYLEIGSKINHTHRNLMALRRIEVKSLTYSENIIQRSRRTLLPIIKD